MASFPLFPSFPLEIQLAIWAFAAGLRDPEPEVCLVWPLHMETNMYRHTSPPEEPVLPFLVDTAWPAVAHVCRAAREGALKSGAVRLRHSPVAGFAVPYRHFIPAIDTLYWGKYQHLGMVMFLSRPENAQIARDLRHLAIEMFCPCTPSELAVFIRERAMYLRSLHIVVPGTMDLPSSVIQFLPPRRRCRLRNISEEALDEIKLAYVAFLQPGETCPMPLRKYIEKETAGMNDHERHFTVRAEEGTAWSIKDRCFSGLEITAQTFVEYTKAGNNQVQWVEVCKTQDRLLGKGRQDRTSPSPRRVPLADRKHPEEYRVLDDDSGWYSSEEFVADLKRDYPELFRNHSWM